MYVNMSGFNLKVLVLLTRAVMAAFLDHIQRAVNVLTIIPKAKC